MCSINIEWRYCNVTILIPLENAGVNVNDDRQTDVLFHCTITLLTRLGEAWLKIWLKEPLILGVAVLVENWLNASEN